MTLHTESSFSTESDVTEVLRQVHTTYTEDELDSFARQLEQVIRHGIEPQAYAARFALMSASVKEGEGTPYSKAVDVFIRIYESYRASPSLQKEAGSALLDIYLAEGRAYVINLFQSTQKPQRPCYDPHGNWSPGVERPPKQEWCDTISIQSEWCRAADVLRSDSSGRLPEAPSIDVFARYCGPYEGLIYIHSDSY